MRQAVMTLWPKPFNTSLKSNGGFASATMHWQSWKLSSERAKQHFDKVTLITDTYGAKLASKLRLGFDEVNTVLDNISGQHPKLWALGKLIAYRMQDRPFLHLDSDVYLWDNPLDHMNEPEVFCQNTEPEIQHVRYYRRPINKLLRHFNLPEWFRNGVFKYSPLNVGIFGGTNTGFIRSYADQALSILHKNHGRIDSAMNALGRKDCPNIVLEQSLLAAYAHYRNQPVTAYLQHPIQKSAKAKGYTHLIGGSKRKEKYRRQVDQHVRKSYPNWNRHLQMMLSNTNSNSVAV